MPLLLDFLWLLAGLAALYYGAEWLVNGSARIAVRSGISPLVVGLTIVAFGTSAPELFVSIGFNLRGYPEMALGNVIGSNICNIGLVLGAGAFLCVLNVRAELVRRDLPVLLAATLVLAWMLAAGFIGRTGGSFLFAAVVLYTIYRVFLFQRRPDTGAAAEFEQELDPAEALRHPLWKLAALILAGLVVLWLGSEWIQRGGVGIARQLGVPEVVISLTLIALGTSVPELATSVVAALKREGDIIVGNIVGSCIFNLLCVLGLTAAIKPLDASGIAASDLLVMIGMTVLLGAAIIFLRRVGRRAGAFLLACYAGYCVFLWFDRVAV